MWRLWETCHWPAGLPAPPTAGSVLHCESLVHTHVWAFQFVCSSSLLAPANSHSLGTLQVAITLTLIAQSALQRMGLGKGPVRTVEVGVGLWEYGILELWACGVWTLGVN